MIELGGADLEDRFWGSPRFIQPVFDKRANREVPPYLSFDDESGADGLWRGIPQLFITSFKFILQRDQM